MFYCYRCKCGFDYEDADVREYPVGECWGVTAYERELVCPVCGGELEYIPEEETDEPEELEEEPEEMEEEPEEKTEEPEEEQEEQEEQEEPEELEEGPEETEEMRVAI